MSRLFIKTFLCSSVPERSSPSKERISTEIVFSNTEPLILSRNSLNVNDFGHASRQFDNAN